MQPLISVIVPVFNVHPFLSDCLRSIVSQTYNNLEIILVDDGSTDGSGELCEEWAKQDARIQVIHKTNGGVSSARNAGIKACSGELIGFVDADDWIEKDMYLCLSEACKNSDMAACGWIDYHAGLNKPNYYGRIKKSTDDYEEAVIQMYERNGYFTSIWNKLFQRSVVMPHDTPLLMELDLSIGEDELWLIKVMKNCYKYSFIPKYFYHYRPRIGSAMRHNFITENRMTGLEAKKRTIRELEGYEKAANYAKSAMYGDCYPMKVQCYVQRDFEKMDYIHRTLRPMMKYWFNSKDATIMSKLKAMILELEMKCRFPRSIVSATSSMTQPYGKKIV